MLALGAVAAPATAGERERYTYSLDPEPRAAGEPFRDTIIRAGSRKHRKLERATAASSGGTYYTPDGYPVEVRVSDAYEPDPAADQALVDLLGSFLHNFEMGQLRVLVLTDEELAARCSDDAAACYAPALSEMVLPGDAPDPEGVAPEHVVAHEYGHHVANYRDNTPWLAFLRGPKRWASYQRVCEGVRDGDYFEGNPTTDDEYYRDVGEAFAQAFAVTRFPEITNWPWPDELKPDSGAMQAIRDDVTDPWSGPTVKRIRRRLTPGGSFVRPVVTPLDGALRITLRMPSGSDFDLGLYQADSTDSDRPLDQSVRSGSRKEAITFEVCGEAGFDVYVEADSGRGRARVGVRKP